MFIKREKTWRKTTQVVGILARARKNRLVHYEGETLWQVFWQTLDKYSFLINTTLSQLIELIRLWLITTWTKQLMIVVPLNLRHWDIKLVMKKLFVATKQNTTVKDVSYIVCQGSRWWGECDSAATNRGHHGPPEGHRGAPLQPGGQWLGRSQVELTLWW